MSHFAKINSDNIVEQVIVIEQDVLNTGHWGDPASWVQTSYNTRGGVHYDPTTGLPSADQSKALRKNFAGFDFTYDRIRDAFIPPKPFNSWELNEDTCLWETPTPMPVEEGKMFVWNEETVSWLEFVPETTEP